MAKKAQRRVPAPDSPLDSFGRPPTGPSFTLEGFPVDKASSMLRTSRVTPRVKGVLEPRAARAAAPEMAPRRIVVEPADVIEVELEDGAVVWVRGDEFRERFAGAAARSGDAADGVVRLSDALEVLPPGQQARGPVKWALKAAKVLGFDAEQQTAAALARAIDGRTSPTRPGLGLFRCSTTTEAFSLERVDRITSKSHEPALIFLHGTGSSTFGGFGDLWSSRRSHELAALASHYGSHVYAFEHATLGASPIDNALELARLVPEGARIHLVSHSRGGLVGELLSRSRADGAAPFSKEELRDYADEKGGSLRGLLRKLTKSQQDSVRSARQRQAESLRALNDVLSDRAFRVERFVRVACPALGTTLASGRLDRWLGVVANVVGRATPNTPLAEAFGDLGDFLLAVVKERTNPESLPGLESMMPESPFIRLVNGPTVQLDGLLAVIAGDIEPNALLAKLLVWVSDRFYAGDHDLVVNTVSMSGGAARREPAVVASHKGANVTHFSYFENDASAQQVVAALSKPSLADAGFAPLTPVEPSAVARAARPRDRAPRPRVFVLPGFMGSELEAGGAKVWIDAASLAGGGLGKLTVDASRVRAANVLPGCYDALSVALEATCEVERFPYDWRLSIEVEAKRFATRLDQAFADGRSGRAPVHIVAHSMGGLVARAAMAQHPAVWKRFSDLGGRIVMLGTPNRGSHAMVELVLGRSRTLQSLALLDRLGSQRALLDVIARWPGLLELLPRDPRVDYFAAATWAGLRARVEGEWVEPPPAALRTAARVRSRIEQAPVDPRRMVYVAGSADVTLDRIEWEDADQASGVSFVGTTRGDGTVTWDNGLLPGLPTYFADVEHGDLANHPFIFPAIVELVMEGTTTRLPTVEPVSRGSDERFPVPETQVELYPSAQALAATAIGAGSRKRRTRQRREHDVRASVVHGNLAFARHAVAVGHYVGDTIISAEKHLDRRLGGALSTRQALGRYPGALETSAIVIHPNLATDPDVTPKGAIVVGLGQVGHLTAATLTRSMTSALLEFVLLQRGASAPDQGDDATRGSSIGVTTLLIGTGAGGISVADSVFAAVRAAGDVNRALQNAGRGERISELEFIELYEDRALQALASLKALATEVDFRDRLVVSAHLETRAGGLKRLQFDEPGGWWHRLQILGSAESPGGRGVEGQGGRAERESAHEREVPLRFTAFTRSARAEMTLLPTQRALVDEFVRSAVKSTTSSATTARTLFELLLPNQLKEQAPDQDNLVLLLDEAAAAYPWELLEDRDDGQRRPFSVERGLLRQLATEHFRPVVRGTSEDAALVVGDPQSTIFPELTGAQAEAREVEKRLRAGAFSVTALDRPRGDRVVGALFEKGYRVLHLAGHGVFQWRRAAGDRPVTGMVIGDDMFLTPAEVEQMRVVPELVFLNCCHLGHIEPSPNKLAANLAIQFIRMGVRAVVAAGWAVDDRAAATFANEFYDYMLRGQSFGTAVQEARKATFARHPGANTWGAYQCYGDPDYRLRLDPPRDAPDQPFSFVSPGQAVVEARNFLERLKTRAGRESTWELGRLAAIEDAVKAAGWLDNVDVRVALGLALGEAKRFDAAIRHLKAAADTNPGGIVASALEQLANFEIRYAPDEAEGPPSPEVSASIARGLARLERLVAFYDDPNVPRTGQSLAAASERHALLASGYKRQALASPRTTKASLTRMADRYATSLALALHAGDAGDADYPRLNGAAAVLARAWQGRGAVPAAAREAVRAAVAESRRSLRTRVARRPDFWTHVMLLECDLLESLARVTTDRAANAAFSRVLQGVVRRYRQVRTMGSERQFASSLDQLEFLATMALRGGKPRVAAALGDVKAQLTSAPAGRRRRA